MQEEPEVLEKLIKHSDVLVEDPEVIEKHAKEPEVLGKRLETEKNFFVKVLKQKKLLTKR